MDGVTPAKPKHDPGGKVRLTLAADVKSTAVFGGKSQEYRYRLVRTWDDAKPHAMFVMMNPSTADPLVDDPTVPNADALHVHGDTAASTWATPLPIVPLTKSV